MQTIFTKSLQIRFALALRTMSSTQKAGIDLLRDPLMNKGVAFSTAAQSRLHLKGLLPPISVMHADEKAKALQYLKQLCTSRLSRMTDDFDRYDWLMRLYDTNAALFFHLLLEHPDEIMPLIYTPTVGAACQDHALVFTHGRGLFITINDIDHIPDILKNWPKKDVRAICVTDGERILGLGDLGAYGMGIPVGKLALYTGLAGLPPWHCLPITLDVGTNNEKLLNDPLYFGLKQKRVTGAAYDAFIDKFMESCVSMFGKDTLIQFEDFGNQNAFRFMEKYEPLYCTFNDDIQGTASVVLSGILSSLRITGRSLASEVIVCYGAGEAMLGFANLVVQALRKRHGLTKEQAVRNLYLVDSRGLLVDGRKSGGISSHKQPFVRPAGTPELTDLSEIVKYAKCTTLLGAAAIPKAFPAKLMNSLLEFTDQPVIMALSNPTSKAECTAEEAYIATKGQCIFASGSPFKTVSLPANMVPPGTSSVRTPGQGNNSYIFPGVALAICAAKIQPVKFIDFLVASESLSMQVSKEDLAVGCLYPPLTKIRDVSLGIARNVAKAALADGRSKLANATEAAIDQELKKLSGYPTEEDLFLCQ